MTGLFNYEKYGKKYSNFYQVIQNENIRVIEFDGYRKDYLQHFIDNNYLKVDKDGIIRVVNKERLIVVGYLRNFEVMSYWHYPKIIRDEIDVMAESNIIKFSNKLFTKIIIHHQKTL